VVASGTFLSPTHRRLYDLFDPLDPAGAIPPILSKWPLICGRLRDNRAEGKILFATQKA
jgi:hypothetical protein